MIETLTGDASLWTAKFTISEFLKRLTGQFWRRSYEVGLQFIRYFLVVTFVGVVIATLVECHPFPHYWQVVPDPGPMCRQGYAQLITMGTCDIITDLLLVGFPIPIVIVSTMPMKRFVPVLRFCLGEKANVFEAKSHSSFSSLFPSSSLRLHPIASLPSSIAAAVNSFGPSLLPLKSLLRPPFQMPSFLVPSSVTVVSRYSASALGPQAIPWSALPPVEVRSPRINGVAMQIWSVIWV